MLSCWYCLIVDSLIVDCLIVFKTLCNTSYWSVICLSFKGAITWYFCCYKSVLFLLKTFFLISDVKKIKHWVFSCPLIYGILLFGEHTGFPLNWTHFHNLISMHWLAALAKGQKRVGKSPKQQFTHPAWLMAMTEVTSPAFTGFSLRCLNPNPTLSRTLAQLKSLFYLRRLRCRADLVEVLSKDLLLSETLEHGHLSGTDTRFNRDFTKTGLTTTVDY